MNQDSPISSTPPQDHNKGGVSDPAKTSQIQPIQFYLHSKEIILDKRRFSKSLLTHFKTSKSSRYTTIHGQRGHHFMKDCQKVLRTQLQLSKLHLLLESWKSFENKYLLSQIRHLTSLSSLILIFGGDSKHHIIPEKALSKTLISLKQLKHLDLFFINLSFDDPELFKNLAKSLHKVSKVSSLSLEFFNCQSLTSLHYNFLLSKLPKFNALRSLMLGFSHSDDLLDVDINTLISMLNRLSLLTKIGLSIIATRQKILPGSTLVKLFKAFQSMKNLSNLTFCAYGWELVSLDSDEPFLESLRCLAGSSIKRLALSIFRNFSNENLKELSEALKEFPLLESFHLNIDEWQLPVDECIAQFGSALAWMSLLTSLSLGFSYRIRNKNIIQTIASALMSLQNLVSLRLNLKSDDEIADEQFQILFTNIRSLRSLKYLNIWITGENKITDTSLEVLGESLKSLNILKNLSLEVGSSFLITNKGVEAICIGIQEGLSNLFGLRLIFGSNQNINEKALRKIGKTLKSLFSLYEFTLEFGRPLEETDLGELFEVFRQMKNIQEIWLSFSNSKGNFREIDWLKKIKSATVTFSQHHKDMFI